ncbi:hypothetical protein AXG93_2960s1100 [Marchantia polymorpha subsp. ruderalis]|uniref:Uncharacterized protein n=1 Tax=Marchantia polymorpha subsp. ruderalis TaxID=1480154 RepID=A0A176W8F9_MARPO|nr:hypothetical protein AXG93_2960s1100 [Marchantia polymorpha subsp. ruderalis]
MKILSLQQELQSTLKGRHVPEFFFVAVHLRPPCDSRPYSYNTFVKDEEGLKIRLDRYNSSWMGKTIEISYSVLYYAAKAGLDVTLGLGQAIPDLADLRSNIVKLVGIRDSDRRAVVKGGESMELKEAWLRIKQTLAPQLRDSYSANFKLYQ